MKIGIDATNIKAGGGFTHLKHLTEEFTQEENDQLILIGGNWLNSIENKTWIIKNIVPNISSLLNQIRFKFKGLSKILKKTDIAFIPGGTFFSKEIPYVTMSQNMLVFENKERNRFPKSFTWLRYNILERIQLKSFRNSAAIIYISNYAKNYIENKYPYLKRKPSTVIYHGISNDFRQLPKQQNPISFYTAQNPFRVLYISIINYYKHQVPVINAVKKLRNEDFFIELELVGPMYAPLKEKFEKSLEGTEEFIKYSGKISYEKIAEVYKKADLFVFASTCENMPNILVEAMSAGLPVLCSSYGPMPEILRDAGMYMDPTNEDDIYINLKKMLLDANARQLLADKAYNYSQAFSWSKTAAETFDFIKKIAKEKKLV